VAALKTLALSGPLRGVVQAESPALVSAKNNSNLQA
jgi:hypothetical protein